MAKQASDYDFETDKPVDKVLKSKEEWRRSLPADVFHVTREAGTERPFSGALNENKDEGIYRCSNCGHQLFSSRTKFDSGTGWPSFWSPISNVAIDTKADWKFFIKRTEVICERCGAHLGHVFSDGPEPTGLRYCINSLSLIFDSSSKKQAE